MADEKKGLVLDESVESVVAFTVTVTREVRLVQKVREWKLKPDDSGGSYGYADAQLVARASSEKVFEQRIAEGQFDVSALARFLNKEPST